MRTIISRWFLFGLLLGWALTHATVFGQTTPSRSPTTAEKLRTALDKNVTLDFSGQSLTEVLNHFRDKTGIAINVDQIAMMQGDQNFGPFGPAGGPPMPAQINLKAKNEKASDVLRKLLNPHQLTFVLFEDGVLITSEESAVMRQMRQRVSINVEDVAFNKAVRELAKNHGINLVIDPKVKNQAEAPVSLQLESTGLETTVRMLAELASLKAVRMGNVMFITTEEKADKIRKEEPQQFDNPLNPNLPIGPPMMRGLAGGFGGIMPMPLRAAPAPFALPPGVAPPGIEVQPNRPVQDPAVPPKKGTPAPPPIPRPQN